MLPTSVQTLLDSVRRRLWREQFATAVRQALWGTAGGLLLVVVLHLALRPVPTLAVWGAATLLWAALLARAATRRPGAAVSALWADRHLGGASAFSTLFELGAAPSPARAWLAQWAASRVPECQQRLAALPASMRLTRPLASTAVCAALTAFVLSLPGRAPPAAVPVVAQASSASAERPVPAAEAAVPAAMVNSIASALRAADTREPAAARGGEGAAADGGDMRPAASSAATATTAGPLSPAQGGQPGTRVDAPPSRAGGTPQTSSSGAGREAGASADRRADVGVSRPLQVRPPVPTSAADPRPVVGPQRADLDRQAAYRDDPSNPADTVRLAAPPAATPPPAAETTRLTPIETTYVQAWLKANPRRP
jgi:hypothetical protein